MIDGYDVKMSMDRFGAFRTVVEGCAFAGRRSSEVSRMTSGGIEYTKATNDDVMVRRPLVDVVYHSARLCFI